MNTHWILRKMQPSEAAVVQGFYAGLGYQSPIIDSDTVFIAMVEDSIVGAARVREEHGMRVLRGLQVRPGYQHQGIGSQLVSAVMEFLDGQDCYCVPYRPLLGFYERWGFQLISDDETPSALRRKVDGYRSKGLDVLVMHRPGIQGFQPKKRCYHTSKPHMISC